MNKKQNTRGFSTQIRKIYVKEDNTLNRFALFLSGLAIALVVLLLINFKSLMHYSGLAKASELSTSESIQEIYDYIDSLNGFTDDQRNVLNSIISDYFNSCSTASEEDLLVVYDLINAKYQTNNSQISEIRSDLESKFSSASSSDYEHYNELLRLVDELTNTVSANKTTEKHDKEDLAGDISRNHEEALKNKEELTQDINLTREEAAKNKEELTQDINLTREEAVKNKEELTQALKDAQSVADESDKKIIQALSDFQDASNDSTQKIWNAINVLNERTTDQNGQYEFDFGFQDGCYGYYVDGKDFKRF
ncbi:hypothetical protein [Pseudobutyrivibrio xylanivorans]|uniref:Uncharacterized protein n=1 Tax=Pseudobutyrivibrio xylanivorans DSM 14809 TaxID=1123012 RepID=A0A1M6IF41_PSEXY|nr:hypothetical protein [Pseudobutyrivibrio xylanivorans]SHJ33070.1 hypothetical protein SAMN02745725_02299 [Pseudobutyrivibrio xylanivorans DSM 14809]